MHVAASFTPRASFTTDRVFVVTDPPTCWSLRLPEAAGLELFHADAHLPSSTWAPSSTFRSPCTPTHKLYPPPPQ
jgi:hypothetical protein